MARKGGNPNLKAGPGRPKKACDKVSTMTRAWLAEFLSGEVDSGKIKREMDTLTGKDYLRAIKDFLEFTLPKPSAEPVTKETTEKTYTVHFG